MRVIYCLHCNACDERGAKHRFQFAGFFLQPDPAQYHVDRDPVSTASRRRRFLTLGFIRPTVGQTCVPWKEPAGSGLKIPGALFKYFGLVTHVTTQRAASRIIWEGLKPGAVARTTGSLELQFSPFPPFDAM